MRSLAFTLVLISSCSIIPDDALESLPKTRIKTISISGIGSEKLIGTVTYAGSVDSPGKIEIAWKGNLKIMQIPITDNTAKIIKTIYHLTDGKVSKIININEQNIEVRSEEFTYDSKGLVVLHKLIEKISPITNYTFENKLYYSSEGYEEYNKYQSIDSVYQTRCQDNNCYNGFFASSDLNLYSYSKNSPTNADFINIIPYDPTLPYTYDQSIPSEYFEDLHTTIYSKNDIQKSFFGINLDHYSYYGYDYSNVGWINTAAENYNCQFREFRLYNYSGSKDYYYDSYPDTQTPFEMKDEELLLGYYYFIIPGLLPQAGLISLLSKKMEYDSYVSAFKDFEILPHTHRINYISEVIK